MAVDLKSTVRKDLRVQILRPPLKYSLEFVSLKFGEKLLELCRSSMEETA